MPTPNEILQFHCPVVVQGSRIAWAAGKYLVVYNFETTKFETDFGEPCLHSDTIRAIAFGPNHTDKGPIVTAGEDKRVVLHSVETKSFLHGKKIMAIHIDEEERIIFGDKFGDFYRMNQSFPSSGEAGAMAADENDPADEDEEDERSPKFMELMFGHISAISTSLFSCRRNILITADRDEKIRIAKYPRADVIESFLLKHKRYVSHLVWGNKEKTVLVSAGADGQIVEWDIAEPGKPRIVKCHNTGYDGFHTVTCNVETGEIFFVPVEHANTIFVIGGRQYESLPFEIQTLKMVPLNGQQKLICIDANSHLHVLNEGAVETSIRLSRDIAGVPISYLKMVHHENLNDEDNQVGGEEPKRKKKGGPFS